MWRPLLKNVSWMKDFVGTFTRRADFVMLFCAGTCPTAIACMLHNQYKKFVGCDLYSDLLSAAKLGLLLTFSLEVLIPKSDTTGDDYVRAASRTFKEKAAAGWTR